MNLEIEFQNNKNLNWDYTKLSSNEYITWNMIKDNLQKPWDFSKLSSNPIITWDIIENTPFLKWDWSSITVNVNITLDIISNNINYPWDFIILENILSTTDYNYLIQCRDNYIDDINYDSSDSGYDESNVLYMV